MLITRAQKQANSLANLLQKHGAEVVEVPFIEMIPPDSWAELDESLRHAIDYDWLILTSVNGVAAFFERAGHLGVTIDELQHLKIAAIGPATADAISDHGLVVDVVPDLYVAERVVHALRRKVQPGERVLIVRAKVARDVIPQELARMGAKVDVREAYQTIIPEGAREKLAAVLTGSSPPDVITFTSSSTVENMMQIVVGADIARHLVGIRFAAIGPVTAATLKSYGLPVHIEAEEYTMPGLVRAIERHFDGSQ